MRWDVPDDTIPHFPEGRCPCGRDLAEARDLGTASSAQQLDLPGPRAKRIQHDMHAARSACGREHVAARPPGVPDAALSIGPGLRALAVCLLVYQHTPAGRPGPGFPSAGHPHQVAGVAVQRRARGGLLM